jgi:hypothetical protein
MSDVSWVVTRGNGRRPHVNGTLTLEATVANAGVPGDCDRSGKVHFTFDPTSTGGQTIDLGFGDVVSSVNALNDFVSPTGTGVAQQSWIPTDSANGTLYGAVSCDASACGAMNCDEVDEEQAPPYLASIPLQIFATDRVVVAADLRREDRKDQDFFFGFGVAATRADTRLTARAIHSSAPRSLRKCTVASERIRWPLKEHDLVDKSGLVVPTVRLAVTAAAVRPDAGRGIAFHSGILAPKVHFDAQMPFAGDEGGLSRVVRKAENTQGILQVTWPRDSEGAHALVEIVEEDAAGRRLGGFFVGLTHTSDVEDLIWL